MAGPQTQLSHYSSSAGRRVPLDCQVPIAKFAVGRNRGQSCRNLSRLCVSLLILIYGCRFRIPHELKQLSIFLRIIWLAVCIAESLLVHLTNSDEERISASHSEKAVSQQIQVEQDHTTDHKQSKRASYPEKYQRTVCKLSLSETIPNQTRSLFTALTYRETGEKVPIACPFF
jgi:hypothetical protein